MFRGISANIWQNLFDYSTANRKDMREINSYLFANRRADGLLHLAYDKKNCWLIRHTENSWSRWIGSIHWYRGISSWLNQTDRVVVRASWWLKVGPPMAQHVIKMKVLWSWSPIQARCRKCRVNAREGYCSILKEKNCQKNWKRQIIKYDESFWNECVRVVDIFVYS